MGRVLSSFCGKYTVCSPELSISVSVLTLKRRIIPEPLSPAWLGAGQLSRPLLLPPGGLCSAVAPGCSPLCAFLPSPAAPGQLHPGTWQAVPSSGTSPVLHFLPASVTAVLLLPARHLQPPWPKPKLTSSPPCVPSSATCRCPQASLSMRLSRAGGLQASLTHS